MTRRSQRCERFAALMIGPALVLAIGGCSEGYPRDDLDIPRSASGGSAVTIVAR